MACQVVTNKHLREDGHQETHTDLEFLHYGDVITSAMVSQITSLTIVNSTVYSGADERKHHSSASLAFVRGFHRWPIIMEEVLFNHS